MEMKLSSAKLVEGIVSHAQNSQCCCFSPEHELSCAKLAALAGLAHFWINRNFVFARHRFHE